MRVLLIRPPYTRLRRSGQAPYFPLGVGYIASHLIREGHECRIYSGENPGPGEPAPAIDKQDVFAQRSSARLLYLDAVASDAHAAWHELAQVIRDLRPDLVGISVLTVEFGSALRCSRIVKSIAPQTPVIWGGVHPTFLPDSCLRYPEVDFAVRGEGEITLAELCRELAGAQRFGQVQGLSWKDGEGRITHNPERDLLTDLDAMPMPARDAVVFPERFDRLAMGSITCSRGCPYRCTFCSSRAFWRKRVRFRKAARVAEEVREVVKSCGVRDFTFWDDTFSVNRKATLELCRELGQLGSPITFKTATRSDVLDDEILVAMRRAGCVQLQLGIETGSPRMSKLIEKELELSAARGAVRLINRHGIAAGTFFMVGYPQETLDDMRQTFEVMKGIGSTDVVLNVFDPMPGSVLFETARALGLVAKRDDQIDWTTFPLWPDAHYVRDVGREEFGKLLQEISSWCFRWNHSPSAVLRRMRPQLVYLLKNDPGGILRKGVKLLRGRRAGSEKEKQ